VALKKTREKEQLLRGDSCPAKIANLLRLFCHNWEKKEKGEEFQEMEMSQTEKRETRRIELPGDPLKDHNGDPC